jgi:hypothetical protein
MFRSNLLKMYVLGKMENLLIPIFFLTAATLVFAPAIYRPSIFQVMGGDVYHNLWIWGRNVSNVMSGSAPYTPNIFFPDQMSSFYSEMEIGNSMLYGLFTLIGLHPMQIYLIIVLLSFAMTGIMVALISRRLGASAGGAIVGGAIAAFASYRYNHLAHVQGLSTYWALMPLYFSLSYLMLGKRRDLVLALIMHIPILCGPSYNLMGLILLETGTFLAFVLDGGVDKKIRWKRSICLVLAVLVAGLFTIPIWLGYLELFKNGFVRDHNELLIYAMNLMSFLTPPEGSMFYGELSNALNLEGQGTLSINSTFLGFVATYFLCTAIFFRQLPFGHPQLENPTHNLQFLRAIKLVGIIFFLFSLGSPITWGNVHLLPNPVFWLGEITHFLSATRYIAHYGYFGIVAMSIIIAYQTSHIFQNARLAVRVVFFLSCTTLVILENFVVYASDIASLPKELANVPQIYRQLAKLPSEKAVLFLPLPANPNIPDSATRLQFEYMFNSQYHRLSMLNGHSGFFPPHYTQSISLLNEFPSLSGLNFILKDNIDFVVYDKRSGQPMDFSKEKIHSVCPNSLKSIFTDNEYELFKVDLIQSINCVQHAGVNELEQWIYLPNRATPHQVGQFDENLKLMISKEGQPGALIFGQNVVLENGKYRAFFSINTPNSILQIDVGSIDVYGTNKKGVGKVYAVSKIYSVNQKQRLELEFDVEEKTNFEFRVWSNGKGDIEVSRIGLK